MEHFAIGAIVVLNESYGGRVTMPNFKGEVVGYSKRSFSANGDPCVRIKRLDLPSGAIQLWGQGWLEIAQ